MPSLKLLPTLSLPDCTLDPRQREAVEETQGPLLILGRPGTGKTTTLVERLFHLVLDLGVPPEAIILATCAKAAAADLADRVASRAADLGADLDPGALSLGYLDSINLEDLRPRPSYLMVDDFEEASAAQEGFLLALAASGARLCMAGDLAGHPSCLAPGACKVVELATTYLQA